VRIVEASPDFGPVVETFTTLRALHFVTNLEPILQQHRDQLKPEVVWNIERGLDMRAAEIGTALRERGLLQRRVASFLGEHDVLLCPTTIVPPFPVEQRYVERVGEHRFASYVDWLTIVYAITLSGCPALSLPCGFTDDGLPVGMQVVGRPRGEAKLLATAAALEEVLGLAGRVPMTPCRS
jgi:amidase